EFIKFVKAQKAIEDADATLCDDRKVVAPADMAWTFLSKRCSSAGCRRYERGLEFSPSSGAMPFLASHLPAV
ncbi:MAG: hypothetical protein ACK4RG_08430, partial [Fimbriimonadales bacterium]